MESPATGRHPRWPPGPNDLWGLRTMSWMRRNVLEAYTKLHQTYGDIVSFRTGPYRLFVFFHPDQVHDVLIAKAKSMIRLPRVMQTFAQWNGESLLVVEGTEWFRQRRLVNQGFPPRRFENYGRIMTACTRRLIQSWEDSAASRGEVEMEIRQPLTALTLEIIGKTMFDVDLTADSGEISRAVAILSEVAFHEMQAPIRLPSWWPTEFYRRKRWAIKTLDDVVWRIVRQRRAEGTDHGDLLSMLLAAVDDEEGGGGLNDRQVRDNAVTLILAGHDTSAAALEWLCWLLARHSDVTARCRAEVKATIGDREATHGDISHLPYLTATIKETMRLYPPAIAVFLRQAISGLSLGGYDVPKGSLISLSSYVTHRDARWFPDPAEFSPERFLPGAIDRIPTGAYFPFGAGPRACIGQAFAMMEMTLIVATMLQHGSWQLRPSDPTPTPHVFMALRPRDPVTLRWVPHKVAAI